LGLGPHLTGYVLICAPFCVPLKLTWLTWMFDTFTTFPSLPKLPNAGKKKKKKKKKKKGRDVNSVSVSGYWLKLLTENGIASWSILKTRIGYRLLSYVVTTGYRLVAGYLDQ
jgi:hypothetical protein